MRQLVALGTAFFAMCMGVLAFGQTGASDNAGAEQQVKQLEQQVRNAVLKGDTSVLAQHLSDDYVGIAPDGQVLDKNQSIQNLKNGTVKYSSIDVTDERVRMYGDTAIYSGSADVKMTIDGQPQNGKLRATIVWAKQNGQWKRVSFQATPVQTATAAR
jgi:ketosteroid isomerase-like protein